MTLAHGAGENFTIEKNGVKDMFEALATILTQTTHPRYYQLWTNSQSCRNLPEGNFFFHLLKEKFKIPVEGATPNLNEIEELDDSEIISESEVSWKNLLDYQQKLMKIELNEAEDEISAFRDETEIIWKWKLMAHGFLFSKPTDFRTREEFQKYQNVEKYMRAAQGQARKKTNRLRRQLARSLTHKNQQIFPMDVNPSSLKKDLLLKASFERAKGHIEDLLDILRQVDKEFDLLENPENRSFVETWHNSIRDGILALKNMREDISNSEIIFKKFRLCANTLNKCLLILSSFVGPTWNIIYKHSQKMFWIASALERETFSACLRHQIVSRNSLNSVNKTPTDQNLNILELFLTIQERLLMNRHRIVTLDLQRSYIFEEMRATYKTFEHLVCRLLSEIGNCEKAGKQKFPTELSIFDPICILRESQIRVLSFLTTIFARLETERQKILLQQREINCLRGCLFARNLISEHMVSYLLSVETNEQKKVQAEWISGINTPYHCLAFSSEKKSIKETTNANGPYLSANNANGAYVDAICASSVVLLDVVIKNIELYYLLCMNGDSQDHENKGTRESYSQRRTQTYLIRDGVYELVMFGLRKLKDGIDKKSSAIFFDEISFAMDNFPLQCNETLKQFKKQKDKLILHIIADAEQDSQEHNNKNVSVVAKGAINIVANLTAIEQQHQLRNIIQQIENQLAASRSKHDALTQLKHIGRQKQEKKPLHSSRKKTKQSQKKIPAPLQNLVINHLDGEFNQSNSFIQKLEERLLCLKTAQHYIHRQLPFKVRYLGKEHSHSSVKDDLHSDPCNEIAQDIAKQDVWRMSYLDRTRPKRVPKQPNTSARRCLTCNTDANHQKIRWNSSTLVPGRIKRKSFRPIDVKPSA